MHKSQGIPWDIPLGIPLDILWQIPWVGTFRGQLIGDGPFGPGPFSPFGPGSRPIWTIWALDPAHLGLGPGPFGPGSWPIWPIWAWVPAHLAHLGLGPGPFRPSCGHYGDSPINALSCPLECSNPWDIPWEIPWESPWARAWAPLPWSRNLKKHTPWNPCNVFYVCLSPLLSKDLLIFTDF